MQSYIKLKNGTLIPRVGMGTRYLGENWSTRDQEVKAICAGIDAGMKLIDTAEIYGRGQSEQLIGQAIRKYRREDIFLISKVIPDHAGKEKIGRRLRHSLQFLRTDYLDLYLLQWRGTISLEETVECMEDLVAQRKIRSWGVSNFDVDDMEELIRIPGGENCAVNQVLYHLGSRGVEYELLPWLDRHHIPMMAYCPLAQAGKLQEELLKSQQLKEVAGTYHISVIQLLLVFVLQKNNVIAIPRSGKKEHVLENWNVRNLILEEEHLSILNKLFPAPKHKVPLDTKLGNY